MDQGERWKTHGKRLEKEFLEEPPPSHPLVPEAEWKTWNRSWNGIWNRIRNGIRNGTGNETWKRIGNRSWIFPVPVECQKLKVRLGSGKTQGKRLEKEFLEKPPPPSHPLVPEAERKTWNGTWNGIWNRTGKGIWNFPSPYGMLGVKGQAKLWKTHGKGLEKEFLEKPPPSHPLVPEAERKTWNRTWNPGNSPERRELKVGVGLSTAPGNSSSFF